MGFRCEVNEDVDGSLMVQLFGGYCFHICLESVSKHLHTLGQSLFESKILVWK